MNVSSGMGGSSRSSSSGTRSQRRTAAPRCKCGRPSVVYTSKTQELEDSRLNKLELNNAEVEFKLNYMEMKLNDELQVKLNEHGMKIREQQRKMIELSMKMVAEFDRVEKEIRLLGRWARVFAVIVVVGAICIYVGGRLE
ncbi:hypothetical protein K1719_040158 [Acacia pycnantha]|nr:hypothetical protein K1719_040158 [Acacia pycnantha]